MNIPLLPYIILILLALLSTSGCNDSGTATSHFADGGIGGTGKRSAGVSVGPITGLSSVLVNGVKYDTSEAVITVNGEHATEKSLKLGMVVRVEGTIDSTRKTGIAQHIDFNENVIGPVQMIEKAHNRLKVLGQTVSVDKLTLFEGFKTLDDLKIGDVLEVSGLIDAHNQIQATRITLLSDITIFEVRGEIGHLDPANQTLTIGDLTVDYSEPLIFEGIPIESEVVDIQGILIDDQFVATRFSLEEDRFLFEVGSDIELYGIITQFNNPEAFQVSDLPVTTTAETLFLFGTAADLAQDIELVVVGYWNAESVLVAEEIYFQEETSHRSAAGEISLNAKIEAIVPDNNRITLLGVSIQTTNHTVILEYAEKPTSLSLSDLRIGDDITVFGFQELNSGALIAELLVREPMLFDNSVWLEGPINSVDTATRTLNSLGITIRVDEKTLYVHDTIEHSYPEPESLLIVSPPAEEEEIEEIISETESPFPTQEELEEGLPETATILTAEAFFSQAQALNISTIIVGGEQVGDGVIARLLVLLQE